MTAKTNLRTPAMILALNARMERTRMTNVALADKLGVHEATVRFWRKRRRVPKNRLVREALERFLSGGKA